ADQFEQFVGADDGAGEFAWWWLVHGWAGLRLGRRRNRPEIFMGPNQQLGTLPQIAILRAGGKEVGVALIGRYLERGQEQFTQFVGFGVHRKSIHGPSIINAETARESSG